MTARIIACLLTCCCLAACSTSHVAANDTPPPAAAPAVDCEELYRKILELEKQVPSVFVGLKRSPDKIYADIVQCKSLCRQYVTECPGAAHTCDVKGLLARLEVSSLERQRDELRRQPGITEAEVKSRFDRLVTETFSLAESAAQECPQGSWGRRMALKAVVDLCSRLQLYDKLHATCAVLVKEFAKDLPERSSIHLTEGLAFMSEKKYDEAVKYWEQVIRERSADPEFVIYNEKLFEALNGTGDLEAMEELVELMRADYPTRLPKLPRDHYLYNQYEQWYCMAPFWKGFVQMAQGEADKARDTFKKHVIEVGDRNEKLTREGKKLGMGDICTITLEARTKDLLQVIDELYGKRPEVDFDLGSLWATEKKITLQGSKGKVVAVVFRMPGDVRAASFLQEIDQLAKAREKDGFVALTLGFLSGKGSPEQDARQVQALREDLQKLGVTIPAGYDPDRGAQKIFRSLHGTVGTASFVLFNRKGEYAWFLADPRDMDRKIARRVIDRLLAEKSTP